MSFLRRAEAFWNVVLFPLDGCTYDFEKLSLGELTGILNLTSREDVEILRQKKDTFVRLKCSNLAAKRHILSWETRSTAAAQFKIRIKEDLFKHERQQKAEMWSVMLSLFHAGLRPSWDRSSVTYKLEDKRFYIHPGDIPKDLLPDEIVRFAREHTLPPTAANLTPAAQNPKAPQANAETSNLVTALRQDIALAKQRTAAKTIECCLLRRKLQLERARSTKERELNSKHTATQTPTTTHIESAQQSDNAEMQVDPPTDSQHELVPVEIPHGPRFSVPKFAADALQQPLKIIHDWYTQQQQEAQAMIREQIGVSTQLQTMVNLLEEKVDKMQKTSKASTKSKK